MFAICDGLDAAMGLRLSGMESTVAENAQQLDALLDQALNDTDIGLLVLTDGAVALNPHRVNDIRQSHRLPLIVTVPGGPGGRPVGAALLETISEAIGVKLF